MPLAQGAPDYDLAQVRYGGGPMSSQPTNARPLGDNGWGFPRTLLQEWPNPINHLQRQWSAGLGAQASATSYGWPYEDIYLTLVPPPVPAMQMMARGTMASIYRPGGAPLGSASFARIPSTPVPINYSRTGYY